jgi:hypothetical protein
MLKDKITSTLTRDLYAAKEGGQGHSEGSGLGDWTSTGVPVTQLIKLRPQPRDICPETLVHRKDLTADVRLWSRSADDMRQ